MLHAIRRRLRDDRNTVRVMAPTGKASLAINGTTTWTFAGWTPNYHNMVENMHFERPNAIMKSACDDDRTFGGVQVIVTGDFCQLPPVKPFQHCIDCGSDLVSIDEDSGTIHRYLNYER
ncbi:hypothetical protein C8A05DRAFT_39425 [Staphylotrichum tortipilum]|uniref:ATP-dependent DNA helicase n=1 Tax=Staphylotrichum tortipilum TaxID=2831512 RepID=A0AAN6MBI6_9PEZI|nr:hypothetical protein C8A05DRAFT_39425 [Staphylotrichum longicolle]